MSFQEKMNESITQKKKDFRIISKWISFDFLAYIQESWRWPYLFERKNHGVHRT